MQDQNLTCKDCGASFVWTAGEQKFYQDKGFTNAPTRCPNCRMKKKADMQGSRPSFTITCSNCGAQDTVPFEPKSGKPVLCQKCFKAARANA